MLKKCGTEAWNLESEQVGNPDSVTYWAVTYSFWVYMVIFAETDIERLKGWVKIKWDHLCENVCKQQSPEKPNSLESSWYLHTDERNRSYSSRPEILGFQVFKGSN